MDQWVDSCFMTWHIEWKIRHMLSLITCATFDGGPVFSHWFVHLFVCFICKITQTGVGRFSQSLNVK